jgi:hypothetical protein
VDLRDCDTCNKPFVADADWKRQCVICWKGDKEYKLGIGDLAFQAMQEAYVELQAAVGESMEDVLDEKKAAEEALEAARVANKRLTKLLAEKRKELRAARAAQPPPFVPPAGPVLNQKQIHALIRLCHPDRHKGSELSTKMTQWLLNQRKK